MPSGKDTGWMLRMAMLQNAITREDFITRLAEPGKGCLDMLLASHDLNVNYAITSKPCQYTFKNTNVKKGEYECTCTVTMTWTDTEGNELECEKDYTYKYKDVEGKNARQKINDRLAIYYNAPYWTVTWLKEAWNAHKGDTVSWKNNDTSSVTAITWFDPEPES